MTDPKSGPIISSRRERCPIALNDPAQWPFWMKSDEVAEALRESRRNFERGRASGRYKFQPVRRGLWARSDVWAHMGYSPQPAPVVEPREPGRSVCDPVALRERALDARFKKKPRPFPPPRDPARYEEYLGALELSLLPGVFVEPKGDTWLVRFRGQPIPIGAKHQVRLTRQVQILICEQVRQLRQGHAPNGGPF